MVRSLRLPLVAAVLLSFATAGFGQTFLRADLTNGAENPPVNTGPRPASFGYAFGVLNAAQTELTWEMTVYNIDFTGNQTPGDSTDNLTLAHIHGSATVTPTTNAGVVWGFIGTPFNDTTPTDTVVTPFASGVGGTVLTKWDAPEGNSTTLGAQISNLLTVHTYLNFHTVQFGGGEVRGMIRVVPEPSTALVLAFGALGLAARRRR